MKYVLRTTRIILLLAGGGKTTLLNVLTGTISGTCGHVTLNGEPLDRRWRRKMAYVMQKDVFYPSLTLRETLTVTELLLQVEHYYYC